MTEDHNNDVVFCVECKNKENDLSKLITCLYCLSSAHFKCRSITGSAIRKLKENMYFCSSKCSDMYKKINDIQSKQTVMIGNLSSELKKTVTTVVTAQLKEVKIEVGTIVKAVEDSQQYLSSKFDDIMNDFQNLKAENGYLRSEVDALKRELSSLKSFVNKLECNVDKVNKESLSNNAMIFGMPVQTNEKVSDLVTKVADCIGAEIPSDALVSASRVFAPRPAVNEHVPIRIVFKSKAVKESFFSRKREFGKLSSSAIDQSMVLNGKPTNVAIRDELTPLSLDLLHEMRDVQRKLNLKYVWPGRDGFILVKKDEQSKPIVVKNRNDINSFVNQCLSPSSSKQYPSSNCKRSEKPFV